MSEAAHIKAAPTGSGGGKQAGKVKNKLPAPIQISAEQLLREAKERQLEIVAPPPRQKITDPTELAEFRMRKRKTFEDNIRKNRSVMVNWIKYARWEEENQEFQRARSVYERALDVDHRCVPIWLKYCEMEMRHKQVNHARNLWDRAVLLLPRVSQFWYKYTYMEEMLENVAGARQVFERWMEWEPEEQAWSSYINMELRYKEIDRARDIYTKFVLVHPKVKNWIKFAKFEEKHGNVSGAREVYERAVDFFGEDYMEENLFIGFAKFEEGQKEYERTRTIYKYALEKLTKENCPELFKAYSVFEKKFGDRRGIEDVIINKRRFKYETEIKANPLDYDAWFDLLRLLESDGSIEDVRDTYERAIANIPLVASKRGWRRYIYLWINYALFEELETGDVDKTREVYKACLDIIPHKKFTFGKIWLMYAQFEIRQKNVAAVRKILGTSIGKCPKPKLFKGYIDLELQMREFDRCRKIYEKFLEFDMSNCNSWIKFAELESILGDSERARAIFELAIGQPLLDMPEILWKAYIDFEVEEEEYGRVRALYKTLLSRTHHVKVWISFANFESGAENFGRARKVFEEADKTLGGEHQKEERVLLLEAWREFEGAHGTEETREGIRKKMPRRVKKRRRIEIAGGEEEEGGEGGWEEYWDYIFPDSEANSSNLKLLQMAKMWKKGQQNDDDDDEEDDDDEDDDEEEEEDEKEDDENDGEDDEKMEQQEGGD